MADLALYEIAHSPFCIAIARALEALGVPFARVEVPAWDRGELGRLTQGRYYQVPVLVHGEQVVCESGGDSQDVARYVEAQFGRGRLFPAFAAGTQEILIEHLEDKVEDLTFKLVDPPYVDSIAEVGARTMVVRHKERKFGRGCVEAWRRDRDLLRAEADRLLARFERMLGRGPFLLGDTPVYADFSLYGIIGNLTYKGYNQLSPDQSLLQAWSRRLAAFRYP
jgi:glutathione S-transferase